MTRSSDPAKELALILRSIRHSESSRIVTMFGLTRGKFAGIAKGARRAKSGSALAAVEPPGLVEALVYFKPHRGVQTLGTVTVLNSFPGLRSNLASGACAAAVEQLIERAMTEGDPNTEVFNCARQALEALDRNEGDPRLKLWAFMLNLFRAVGFGLDLFTCPVCGRETAAIDRVNRLALDSGAVCCHTCLPNSAEVFTLSGESVSILRLLGNPTSINYTRLKVSPNARREITLALERFLKFHHPEVGELTALKMLDCFE